MIKKIMTILMVIAMSAALFACTGKTDGDSGTESSPGVSGSSPAVSGGEPTGTDSPEPEAKTSAFEAFSEVAGKLKSGAEQYDVDFSIVVDITYTGDDLGDSMNGNIKMKPEGDKTQYAIKAATRNSIKLEMVTDGEKIYYTVDDSPSNMSMEELLAFAGVVMNTPEFTEAEIISASAEKSGGLTTYTLTVDGSGQQAYVESVIGVQYAALSQENGMEVSDITITLQKDAVGAVKTMGMDITAKVVVRGEDMNINATYDYTFLKLGSGVNIDLSKLS